MTTPATREPTHFRALARQAVSLSGELRSSGADAAWQRQVQVIDLSLAGACLELSEPVAAGETIELVIVAPHLWDPLNLSGTICWVRGVEPEGQRWLLGLRFEHASGGSVRALSEVLEAQAFT